MKKYVFTLLALLACTIYPVRAYEYFTIYFSDGTKSEAFYATDVDSICYSKLSLDSIAYDEWQVQEIYTCDSVYRYPLAQIDSLSFKDVDVNQVALDIASVSEAITPVFNDCKSPIQLNDHLQKIQGIDGVEDAYISNQTLFVKIRDWGYISFVYPIEDTNFNDDYINLVPSNYNSAPMSRRRSNEINGHQHTKVLKACVVNQQYKDYNREWFQGIANKYCVFFSSMGIDTITINMPSPGFFQNEIFDYDVVFIKTHGCYEVKRDLHWFCTGEELGTKEPQYGLTDDQIGTLINNIRLCLKNLTFSSRKMSFAWIPERRNGDSIHVLYTTISDEFIRSTKRNFRNAGSAIVFNTACESMMNNYKMAKAFKERGAACYLGYDDTNSIGGGAGIHFFAHLLGGKSLSGAYKAIPQQYKEQTFYLDTEGKMHPDKPSGIKSRKCNPKLKPDSNEILSICITHPETISAEETSDGYILKGQMKVANINGIYEGVYCGFQIDTNLDMSQADPIERENEGYDPETLCWNWEATLDENDLEPNTTYYYRAYMNDGFSNCYGEIKQFTTKGDAEAYAVLKDSTLTFYYDMNKENREGLINHVENYVPYHIWVSNWKNIVSKVVFDKSFSNYRPTSTASWFMYCESLNYIENIQYLNTSNVKDMSSMFSRCSTLKSLDVSSFNTANVTNMEGMFSGCESLKSLDVSNFNTSNVTDMGGMFSGCSSLTSLDVSNFNTSNVTDIGGMFSGCSSLTSLDLSRFDTSNVTNMRLMFNGCSSLTSLDFRNIVLVGGTGALLFEDLIQVKEINLENANTTQATDINNMFLGCSSLTNLDVSSFNTSNVTSMGGMFSGCSSLKSLNVSSFNTSNVTDMRWMFNGCSSLTSLDLSNFILAENCRINSIFRDCSSLRTIYASDWGNHGNPGAFERCDNLVGEQGTKIGNNYYYDLWGNYRFYICGTDGIYARIDRGKDAPGLFTAK